MNKRSETVLTITVRPTSGEVNIRFGRQDSGGHVFWYNLNNSGLYACRVGSWLVYNKTLDEWCTLVGIDFKQLATSIDTLLHYKDSTCNEYTYEAEIKQCSVVEVFTEDTQRNKIINTYESGLVQRYHAHPRFARFGQTNGQHQWSVAMLLLMLHPDPSANLIKEALGHDTAERYLGDMPGPLKRAVPSINKDLEAMEERVRNNKTLPVHELTEEERKWLKLCDRLECVMFAANTLPEGLETTNWKRLMADIRTLSQKVVPTPRTDVSILMHTVKQRKGFEETFG